MSRRPSYPHIRRRGLLVLAWLPALSMVSAIVYVIFRTVLMLMADYAWYEKVVGTLLLAAEIFLVVHGLGYMMEILRVFRLYGGPNERAPDPPTANETPSVAVVVASYKEPLDLLEKTLSCLYAQRYSNKEIYLLDDTRYDLPGQDAGGMQAYRQDVEELCAQMGAHLFRRQWRGAKAGIVNDFLAFIDGNAPEGARLVHFGDTPIIGAQHEYLAIFDADQAPMPEFLEHVVAHMQDDATLAFVQTPQYYTNFQNNRVAHAAGMLQAVFYEYICEGKGLGDSMFCCGTNVLFRIKALQAVGGFDESSVTEDFATSLRLHLSGWHSRYSPRTSVFGLGPEDLGAFFKQQFRWARGTVGLMRPIIKAFIRQPTSMPLNRWFEYLLSGTYYFVGWVFLILLLCPVLYLVFDIPTYMDWPGFFFAAFVPYMCLTVWAFFWTLKSRHYKLHELLLGQTLVFVTAPIYAKACVMALLDRKSSFVVTPKGSSQSFLLRDIGAQLALWCIVLFAIVWGLNRLIYEQQPAFGLLVNLLWCIYHLVLLSFVFYFNQPNRGET